MKFATNWAPFCKCSHFTKCEISLKSLRRNFANWFFFVYNSYAGQNAMQQWNRVGNVVVLPCTFRSLRAILKPNLTMQLREMLSCWLPQPLLWPDMTCQYLEANKQKYKILFIIVVQAPIVRKLNSGCPSDSDFFNRRKNA